MSKVAAAPAAAAIQVDPTTETSVVQLVAKVFNPVAIMDPETMRHNMENACEGGFSKKDRSIRGELANYLISRFSLMVMGLVSNKAFRDMVRNAVEMEVALDNESPEFIKEARDDMSRGIAPVASKGAFVLNFSSYNDSVFKGLEKRLSASMERVAEFEDEMLDLQKKLTPEEMQDIGYIVSNFMYLIRAFAQNPLFTSCVKSTFADVQKSLGLEFR